MHCSAVGFQLSINRTCRTLGYDQIHTNNSGLFAYGQLFATNTDIANTVTSLHDECKFSGKNTILMCTAVQERNKKRCQVGGGNLKNKCSGGAMARKIKAWVVFTNLTTFGLRYTSRWHFLWFMTKFYVKIIYTRLNLIPAKLNPLYYRKW